MFLRSSDFFLISPLPWTRCLWFGATVAPLLGISRGSTFLTLVAIQTAVFFSLALGGDRRLRPTARELSGVSLVLWMAMTPLGWWRESFPGMDRPECVLLAVGVYLLLQCCRLRSSLAGLMAAMVTMAGISALVPRGWAEPLAVQTGLALFLAHGMFWRQRGFSGAGRILRLIAALLWMVMAWFQHPPLGWGVQSIITLEAMVVLSLWGWRTRAIESPVEWGVPMGAMAAILIPPVQWSLGHLTPGLFAVVGSFVLFGLGIGAAWSRSLWASHSMTPSVISEAENRNTIIDS